MKHLDLLFLFCAGCATKSETFTRSQVKDIALLSCEAGYVNAVVEYKPFIPEDVRHSIVDNKLYETSCKNSVGRIK